MNAFPNPHSMLILDKCPIHHQRRVMESAHARGIFVQFLEPYDPDSMPVETAYKIMKNWLRINGKMLNDMGLPMGVAFGESESQLLMRDALGQRERVGPASLFPPGRVRLMLAWNTTERHNSATETNTARAYSTIKHLLLTVTRVWRARSMISVL
jgi:hypothetical protein